MTDRFGVPDAMFGLVPEEFYSLTGRIALVSALLEDRILALLWALDDQPQDTHAGRPASQLIREIEFRLDRHYADLGDDLNSEIRDLLVRVADALDRRNALLHSLWPNPTVDHAQGWRPKRRPRSSGGGSETVWTYTSVEELSSDLARLLSLADAARVAASRVYESPLW